jgi:hypothetical protein
VEVLAVPVPLQLVVERLVVAPLGQRLPDPQSPAGGVRFPLVLAEAAQPPSPGVVEAVAAQHVVNLIDEPQRELRVAVHAGGSRQSQEVADREGVGPQVATLRAGRLEARAGGERQHQPRRLPRPL